MRRWRAGTWLLAAALAACTPSFPPDGAGQAASVDCYVVAIHDGDTLSCLTADKQNVRVRLAQIDAPERGQAFGTVARRHLADKVFQQQVQLRVAGTDRYQRTVAEVLLGSANLNQVMVQDGYAWAYREYLRDRRYLQLEQEARQQRRGLWADPQPQYPADFRRERRQPAQP